MNKAIATAVVVLFLLLMTIPAELQWKSITEDRGQAYDMCRYKAEQIKPQIIDTSAGIVEVTNLKRHQTLILCMAEQDYAFNILHECNRYSTDEICFFPTIRRLIDFKDMYSQILQK